MVVTAAVDDRYLPGDAPSGVVWQVLFDFGMCLGPSVQNVRREDRSLSMSQGDDPADECVMRRTRPSHMTADNACKLVLGRGRRYIESAEVTVAAIPVLNPEWVSSRAATCVSIVLQFAPSTVAPRSCHCSFSI